MLKKTISYIDFNGNEVTEDFYFNLTKAELAEMELKETIIKGEEQTGGMVEKLNAIAKSGEGRLIIEVFKDIIAKSYGVKSEDGKRFIKSPELFEEFSQTEAYSELFMSFVTNADAAAQFINGIMPADIAKKAQETPQPPQLNS